MQLKAGSRLRSQADSTEVVVVRAPDTDLDIRCGGHPMTELSSSGIEQKPLDPQFAAGAQLGKRYVDESLVLEVLCTKAGPGSLAVGDKPLSVKAAKPLPSSD